MDNAPYNLRRGRTVSERNTEKASAAFNKTPEGQRINALKTEVAQLKQADTRFEAKLAAVEKWQAGAIGHDGIAINGNVFTYDPKVNANRTPAGGGDGQRLKFFGVKNGAFAAWRVVATQVDA